MSEKMRQIVPIRVVLLDQSNLPVPTPFLQLLLALDGLPRRRILFGVDQPSDAVLFDELGALARAV